MAKTWPLKRLQDAHPKESTQLLNTAIQSQYSLERRPEKEKIDSTRYVSWEMLTKNTTYTKVLCKKSQADDMSDLESREEDGQIMFRKKIPAAFAVLDEFRNIEKCSGIWLLWTKKGVFGTLSQRTQWEVYTTMKTGGESGLFDCKAVLLPWSCSEYVLKIFSFCSLLFCVWSIVTRWYPFILLMIYLWMVPCAIWSSTQVCHIIIKPVFAVSNLPKYNLLKKDFQA